MAALIDMTGKVFGRLTVREYVARQGWRCECACGNAKIATGTNLRNGLYVSCGCHRDKLLVARNVDRTKHGQAKTYEQSPEYQAWSAMKARCQSIDSGNWDNYGARGIKVCGRWQEFETFFEDMGRRPSSRHTLERDDVNGNYEPSNCRWATWKEQGRNKRSNVRLMYRGENLCLAEWAERSGLSPEVIQWRYHNGWPAEEIVNTPVRAKLPNGKGHKRRTS